ncbi:probable amidase At4g34880 [Actinidia eriantha]|uniref:probable amidase At4g34880 n=1 Tax=Actinidia eriantha TaxID=165200 RepID=UPI002584625C|nr:probable amidase At4g34880 [Actinidia eriantha]
MNATVGSYALLGSEVARDASVVERLRNAGAVILGKASVFEWYHFRSLGIPDGWSARSGQTVLLLFLVLLLSGSGTIPSNAFSIKEASVRDLQTAFRTNQLNSRKLVKFYMEEIRRLNPFVRGVIEVNPDALYQADLADKERKAKAPRSLYGLHGIPVLLKDNIATKDRLNTTAGSFALLKSIVPRDAGVVTKLRKVGAIILGKASLSEWANFRSINAPDGWNARGGQGKNPYVLSANPCGSSSGSAISVAANMVAVSVGTETDGSILCPSSSNAVVGIKPTVGLTSRAGVIPISPRQDSIGPICRTVADAVHVLDAIVGFDYNDAEATREAAKYIPRGGYTQFLKVDALKGKRIGIVRNPFFNFLNGSSLTQAFNYHFQTLRERGAILVDHLEIDNIEEILNSESGEEVALKAEFKLSLNAYLKDLVASPVRSLADVIAFNQKNADLEKNKEFGQVIFLEAEATNGIGDTEKAALLNLAKLTRDGFEKMMSYKQLDAVVTPGSAAAPVLAIGGFPGISVPAGFDENGVPFGITFGGLKGSEPKLIEIAYGFEQATQIRKPPSFKP